MSTVGGTRTPTAEPLEPAPTAAPTSSEPKPPASEPAAVTSRSPSELFEAIAPATVFTRARRVTNGGATTTVSTGVGMVVDDEGHIITTCHQLRVKKGQPDTLEVFFGTPVPSSGSMRQRAPIAATIVACDDARDVGLIKTEPQGVTPVEVAKRSPKPGATLTTIGAQGIGFLWSIAPCHVGGLGILRNDATEPLIQVSEEKTAAFRKDLPTQPHIQVSCHNLPMSGSGAYNAKGELSGIVQFVRFNRDKMDRVHFLASAETLSSFLEESLPQ